MTTLFQLKNLHLAFGEKVIFADTFLNVQKGDKIGLIGLNGHGKSTLFNIIQEKISPDIATPPFIFDKSNDHFSVFSIPQELEFRQNLNVGEYYLQFYPDLLKLHQKLQSIEAKLSEDATESVLAEQQTVLDQIEHLQGWTIETHYKNYLKTFGIESPEADPRTFSGGEQRKLALAIGLSAPSELILWDEPTNHLDTYTIELFEEELKKSQKTMMIISHDRYLLNETTKRILHIDQNQIISFDGTYLDYMDFQVEKQKELEKNLDKLENKHRRELAWMRQGIKARRTRSKKRVEHFDSLNQQINQLKALSRKTIELNLHHSGRKSKQLLTIENGSFNFGEKCILNQVNLNICRGDKIALLGKNGAGKTTLINILQGNLALNAGSIHQPKPAEIIVFDQKREHLNPNETLFDFVGRGQDFVHLPNGKNKHVLSYLEQYLFHRDQVHRPISTLSGGEKNRLQLAYFLTQSADLWVFDEPTNDLDIETIEILEDILIDYKNAIILISHDRSFLDKTCNISWYLHDGELDIFEGGYTQAAEFIQGIELAKKLPPAKNDKQVPAAKTQKAKMSFNQKQRWKIIESEIEQSEKEISRLEQEMAEFDFTQADYQKDYQKLELSLKQTKDQLEQLYQEWEELSELVALL